MGQKFYSKLSQDIVLYNILYFEAKIPTQSKDRDFGNGKNNSLGTKRLKVWDKIFSQN